MSRTTLQSRCKTVPIISTTVKNRLALLTVHSLAKYRFWWSVTILFCMLMSPFAYANPSNLSAVWRLNGNGFLGNLTLEQVQDGALSGTMYGDPVVGYYASGERIAVLLRGPLNKPIQAFVAQVTPDGLSLSGNFYALNASSSGGTASRNVFSFSAQRGPSTDPSNPGQPQSASGPNIIAGSHDLNGNGHRGFLQVSQAADGTLSGNVYGNTLEGHYATGTGSVAFLRYSASGQPFQLYVGRVTASGMNGNFYALNAGAGASSQRVRYDWSAAPATSASPAAPVRKGGQIYERGDAPFPIGMAPSPAVSQSDQIRQWIDSLPQLAIVPATSQPLQVQLPAHLTDAGYLAEGRNVRTVNKSDRLYLFRPFAKEIWPGALVQGASTSSSNAFAEIVLPRAPGTVRLVGGFVSTNPVNLSRHLPVPTGSAVENAREELTRTIAATDAAGTYEHNYVYARSFQDAMVKLNLAYNSGPEANVDYKGSLKVETDETMIVGRITHTFYSAAFDPDPVSQSFFSPDVTLAQVQRYASPQNPPLYVSQVMYGRMFLVVFRTKANQLDTTNALKGAYKKFKGELDVNVKKTLDQTSVKVIQIGSTGASLIPFSHNDRETLEEAIQRAVSGGSRYNPQTNPGLPIGLVLKYVGSGVPGQTAIAQLSTDYSEIVNITAPPPTCYAHQTWDGPGGGWQRVQKPGGGYLRVNPGDIVQITADPSSQNFSGVFATFPYGPDGWYTWPTPRADHMAPIMNKSPFALIGRFGEDSGQGDDPMWDGRCKPLEGTAGCSSAFWVGQARTVAAGEAVNIRYGNVWLGTNDDNPQNGDATKRFNVEVCVTRKAYGDMTTEGKSFSF